MKIRLYAVYRRHAAIAMGLSTREAANAALIAAMATAKPTDLNFDDLSIKSYVEEEADLDLDEEEEE